jgi:two-component system chemotaxis sensor kinase CheA
MGDGKVALILDVLGIAQRANVVSEVRDRALTDHARQSEHADERQTLLLLGIGAEGRLAIPLSVVARLEEFGRDSVEQAGSHEVVQYRDQIMRLVRLGDVLAVDPVPESADGPLQVVVYTAHGRSVGLVVDRILDIVEEALTVQQRERASGGLLGSAVIQGRVTDLIDVRGIIEGMDPGFFEATAATVAA